MNKREKEVAELLLESEEEVLKELEKQYRKALNDINQRLRILQSDELTQSRVYRIEYQEALKKQVSSILEKLHGDEYTSIHKFLSDSYANGFLGSIYSMHGQGVPLIVPIDPKDAVKAVMTDTKLKKTLYDELGIDVNKLKRAVRAEISRGIASGMSYNEIARNLHNTTKAPLARARTIARTEGHRIQQASTFDAQHKAKGKGADVVKQWDATLDGDTRETHRALDGQIREVDEPFESGGMKAMYPGDFGDPAEDCNCRCVCNTRARWALDEDELKTLQERAKFFGLDKTENFEDFKKKYIKAAESIENSEKNGIIKEKKSLEIGFQFFANKGIYKQNNRELEKSVASWKRHIELHKRKVANPDQYDSGWDSKTEAHKAGLIKHWQHEIKTAEENVKDALEELKKRGETS